MWRHLTRGFQQGFKRSVCFEKPDTNLKERKTNSHYNCCITDVLPSVFQNLNRCLSKQVCSAKYKSEHNDDDSRNISHHSLLEACGWSGALVFAWVISKQIWVRQKWSRDEDVFLPKKIFIQQSFVELLADIVKTQPPVTSILPQLQSTLAFESKTDLRTESEFEDESQYAFEAAAQQLQEVHEKAIGEALNRCGIACLSKSTGTEAIKYFQRASEFKYPPASFNMGQCYELGIGAKQDFKQAAQWYIVASEQGHATAMYNLGVFYAHGWGGLKADVTNAKRMFIKAASLGQPDAKAALEKESKYDLLSNTNNVHIPFIKNVETKSDQTELKLLVNNIKYAIGLTNDVLPRAFEPETSGIFHLTAQ